MGINRQDLEIIIALREGGLLPDGGAVAEIGAQQLSPSFLEASDRVDWLRELFGCTEAKPPFLTAPCAVGVDEHLPADAPRARLFWQSLGLRYAAIDIDGSANAIPLDLNFDAVPSSFRDHFDLVTNFGTTEHLANQLNAFHVIHDLTKNGGIMVHHLPAQGQVNHGLINYNMKFFWMLARSNGYEWQYADYWGDPARRELPRNVIDSIALFASDIRRREKQYWVSDSALVIVLRKIFPIPFVPPLDVNTGSRTDLDALKRRYWTVFTPEELETYRDRAAPRSGSLDVARPPSERDPAEEVALAAVEPRPLESICMDIEVLDRPVEKIDLDGMMASPSYAEQIRGYFHNYPATCLISAESRAYLYALTRMIRPDTVVEIGTYMAGTAEVFARALWENGRGVLCTIDPFGAERCPPILEQWPAALREVVQFSPENSMSFLARLTRQGRRIDLILIDGDHSFEAACFDINSAAKLMGPGGIVIIDNAEQTGPFEAARRFLAENHGWRELGNSIASFDPAQPFALPRCSVPDTGFVVLQAPREKALGARLWSCGEMHSASNPVFPGILLKFAPQRARGRLHFRAVYRGFASNGQMDELSQCGSLDVRLDGRGDIAEYDFADRSPSDIYSRFFPNCHHTFEVELFWQGEPGSVLLLADNPRPTWPEQPVRAAAE